MSPPRFLSFCHTLASFSSPFKLAPLCHPLLPSLRPPTSHAPTPSRLHLRLIFYFLYPHSRFFLPYFPSLILVSGFSFLVLFPVSSFTFFSTLFSFLNLHFRFFFSHFTSFTLISVFFPSYNCTPSLTTPNSSPYSSAIF